MSFWFKKKKMIQALAEVLENGREKMDQEMQKGKYTNYSGAEPMLNIAVHVRPDNEPSFETEMKAALTKSYLLLPGVQVLVEYPEGKKNKVTLIDEHQAILDRNPHLLKKE